MAVGRDCMDDRTSRGGFSLFDVVMVLAIIVVLAAIAIPKYAAALSRYRVEAAARRIATDVEYAIARARTTGTDGKITFDEASDAYTVDGAPGLSDPSQPYEVKLAEAPYHTEIVSAGFGGLSWVAIDGYGYPKCGGSLVIRSGEAEKTVILDRYSGKVTVE